MADAVLTTILNTGADAFDNLWDVEITFPDNVTTTNKLSDQVISARAGGFNPPEATLKTYSVEYKGVSIEKPLPTFDLSRKLSFEFRVDANYKLMEQLTAWKHLVGDISGESDIIFSNVLSGNPGANEGTIRVKAYKSPADKKLSTLYASETSTDTIYWTFTSVVCLKVGTPQFKRGGDSTATTITAEFLFGKMFEPWTGVGNVTQTPTSKSTA